MQNKRWSMIETASSTAIGYVVAILAQMVILPLFGIEPSLGENMSIAALFTVVSLVRGYFVRRLFNAIGARQTERQVARFLRGDAIKCLDDPVGLRRGEGAHVRNQFFDLQERILKARMTGDEAAGSEAQQ